MVILFYKENNIMFEYRINFSTGKLDVYKDCNICSEFYKKHPSLRTDNRLLLKQKLNGEFYHVSSIGRKIHKLAIKENK